MSGTKPLRSLVVATDFSPAADRALDHAVDLARRHEASLVLVHAACCLEEPSESPAEEWRVTGTDELERRVGQLRTFGLTVRGACGLGSPAKLILDEAERAEADLILVGAHGRAGWRHFLLGSTCRRVIEHATCPVLAIHENDALWPAGRRILLFATDFSVQAKLAVRGAAEILHLEPADRAVLCHSAYFALAEDRALVPISIRDLERSLLAERGQLLEHEAASLRAARISCQEELVEGYPPDAIADRARDIDAQLIVVGSVGHSGLTHLLMGSTAERITSIAPCPVLVIPPSRDKPAEPGFQATPSFPRSPSRGVASSSGVT